MAGVSAARLELLTENVFTGHIPSEAGTCSLALLSLAILMMMAVVNKTTSTLTHSRTSAVMTHGLADTRFVLLLKLILDALAAVQNSKMETRPRGARRRRRVSVYGEGGSRRDELGSWLSACSSGSTLGEKDHDVQERKRAGQWPACELVRHRQQTERLTAAPPFRNGGKGVKPEDPRGAENFSGSLHRRSGRSSLRVATWMELRWPHVLRAEKP